MTEFGENQTRDFAGNLASLPRLVDLGVILAADCTGGNSVDLQPLIGAVVGSSVQLFVVNDSFIQHDSDTTIKVRYGGGDMLEWSSEAADVAEVVTWLTGNPVVMGYAEDGQPLLFVGGGSPATVGAIHLKALVVG